MASFQADAPFLSAWHGHGEVGVCVAEPFKVFAHRQLSQAPGTSPFLGWLSGICCGHEQLLASG